MRFGLVGHYHWRQKSKVDGVCIFHLDCFVVFTHCSLAAYGVLGCNYWHFKLTDELFCLLNARKLLKIAHYSFVVPWGTCQPTEQNLKIFFLHFAMRRHNVLCVVRPLRVSFFKLCANVHSDTRMKWLDFGVKRSKVTGTLHIVR